MGAVDISMLGRREGFGITRRDVPPNLVELGCTRPGAAKFGAPALAIGFEESLRVLVARCELVIAVGGAAAIVLT